MSETLQRGLAVQVAEVLRERLLGGHLRPGTRINEVVLARELDISRGPLREAVRQLVSEGLLVHSPNRGATVFTAEPDDVRALFELRTALETASARLAAERRDEKDIAALRSACARARKTIQGGRRFVHRLDLDFHRTLTDTARSPRVAEQLWRVQQQIILLRSPLDVPAAHTADSLDDHEEIAAAVADGDGERAAALMDLHLGRVRAHMTGSPTG
ncbi:GntR family transcriptional regulator [Streptomyces sp. NPDC090052]|uniref:GntR family transcriptional regulator n=1 Tax=unclassified Streptomyces TaxID=2593676 RepID=UPI00224FDFAF|nr:MULTISPECIES: GntR family transcriptional regulator [unclassified Streptomyces]MCX4724342.1 GntR family transcriptional regulator [Streptomyces sp. NBC_01306]WSV06140.1 GntR family transcriptional regulator [Streptomyces sp. NBC_01020]WSX44257.1 GntR family transcriptional regulator [Streptomyces sp. NBC_00963]WSX67724.1 GntR family transcriptional regulator [Streptomyces sp. NBC_00932]